MRVLNEKAKPTDGARWKCRLLQKTKTKQRKAFALIMFLFLRFYTIETSAKRVIQASGKMTDKSVSEKSPVLQASTIELQFEFDK